MDRQLSKQCWEVLECEKSVTKSFSVALENGDSISALIYPADRKHQIRTTLILGHGAGASQTHPFMTTFANGFSKRGIDIITFNFLFTERKRRAPDPKAKLEACYRSTILAARRQMTGKCDRLIVGGKSMGGRIASQVIAADSEAGLNTADGAVFLGYPLHPPGRPEKLRDSHLPNITVPILFVQGSRDTFGTPEELQPVIERCHRASLHVVENGDHSLKVKGAIAAPDVDPYSEVHLAILDWIKLLTSGTDAHG